MSAMRRVIRKGWHAIDVRGGSQQFDSLVTHQKLVKWAKKTFVPGEWLSSRNNLYSRFAFKNESDLMLFKLTWQ